MPEVDGMQMSKMIKRLLQKVKSKHEMQDANQILNSTLIELLQNQNFATKIYAVTAMNEEQIGDVYLRYGIEAVLPKPLKMSTLKPIIMKVISHPYT